MQVLALTTTYPATNLLGALCIRDFRDANIVAVSDAIELQLRMNAVSS